MHLSSIELKNIRLFRELKWDIGAKPGWNVVIGDNGSGKTAFLRAISAALVERQNVVALVTNWTTWLRDNEELGGVSLDVKFDENPAPTCQRALNLFRVEGSVLSFNSPSLYANSNLIEVKQTNTDFIKQLSSMRKKLKAADWLPVMEFYQGRMDYVESSNSKVLESLFSAGFGPVRDFASGIQREERPSPQAARHASLFGTITGLTGAIGWLQKIRFKELEDGLKEGITDNIKELINHDEFLPHGFRMDKISSEEIWFTGANGYRLPITALSDGIRSVLSFTFELLYQMSSHFGDGNLFERIDGKIAVNKAGLVLVDEIDAHMHPTWQRKIGFWLTEHFPQIQFIVSTHSPLVCQAAENGSIFRLAAPGTDEPSGEVTGVERERLIFGSVLDAYGTDLFGADISRSPSGQKKQERLAELNQKAFFGDLLGEEKTEQAELLRIFPANF